MPYDWAAMDRFYGVTSTIDEEDEPSNQYDWAAMDRQFGIAPPEPPTFSTPDIITSYEPRVITATTRTAEAYGVPESSPLPTRRQPIQPAIAESTYVPQIQIAPAYTEIRGEIPFQDLTTDELVATAGRRGSRALRANPDYEPPISPLSRGLARGTIETIETLPRMAQIAAGHFARRKETLEGKPAESWRQLEEASRASADDFATAAEEYADPEELQGSIVDNWGLVLKGAWWASAVGSMIPLLPPP